MAKTGTGKVAQFGTKGYGFIVGSDGNKYFVHQKNIYNKSRLRAGTEVVFNIEASEKGLIATNVKLKQKTTRKKSSGNNSTLKIFLVISYLIHLVLIYEVFIK
jgi:CspA family cold shock protein